MAYKKNYSLNLLAIFLLAPMIGARYIESQCAKNFFENQV